MKPNPHQILESYWGYRNFRPLQEEIVNSVLSGNDTLALLPTGGGKSICFQVPALALDGLCLVVSPLIALMKDQVENLAKRGISAAAIYSGMHRNELDNVLSNAINGGIKFLYLSPERLSGVIFRDYLRQMNITLLAIDEAHCISQWGFEFRPEYRRIKEIRELFPEVPVLALTASATGRVVGDIQEQLGFRKPCVFRKSFERPNLNYVVRVQENKLEKMLQTIASVKGSGLVYVRNRKLTVSIADYLVQHGINASFYHAGLEPEVRRSLQEDWIKGKTRIMTCTNAFGMGIDKPDCRLVIHYEMPDCLEAYYQEAGRAGRDEQKAFCLLLFHESDAIQARERLEQSYPDAQMLRKIYEDLHQHFRNPIGHLDEDGHVFDLVAFARKQHVSPVLVSNALRLLEMLDVLSLSDAIRQPSRLQFLMRGQELYQLAENSTRFGEPVRLLLRSYGGMFDQAVAITEKSLAMGLNCSEGSMKDLLITMHEHGIVNYSPANDEPRINFHAERVATDSLRLDTNFLKERKDREVKNLEAMIAYASNTLECRSRVLLRYFDEPDATDCGVCDICRERDVAFWNEEQLNNLLLALRNLNLSEPLSAKELGALLPKFPLTRLAAGFRMLADSGILHINPQQLIFWKDAGKRG